MIMDKFYLSEVQSPNFLDCLGRRMHLSLRITRTPYFLKFISVDCRWHLLHVLHVKCRKDPNWWIGQAQIQISLSIPTSAYLILLPHPSCAALTGHMSVIPLINWRIQRQKWKKILNLWFPVWRLLISIFN